MAQSGSNIAQINYKISVNDVLLDFDGRDYCGTGKHCHGNPYYHNLVTLSAPYFKGFPDNNKMLIVQLILDNIKYLQPPSKFLKYNITDAVELSIEETLRKIEQDLADSQSPPQTIGAHGQELTFELLDESLKILKALLETESLKRNEWGVNARSESYSSHDSIIRTQSDTITHCINFQRPPNRIPTEIHSTQLQRDVSQWSIEYEWDAHRSASPLNIEPRNIQQALRQNSTGFMDRRNLLPSGKYPFGRSAADEAVSYDVSASISERPSERDIPASRFKRRETVGLPRSQSNRSNVGGTWKDVRSNQLIRYPSECNTPYRPESPCNHFASSRNIGEAVVLERCNSCMSDSGTQFSELSWGSK